MKILIVTQKVDNTDPILGFFHKWLEEFSKNCDYVTVICLEKGQYDLPDNVRVFSLGKEKIKSRLLYLWNFFKIIFHERNKYDVVFVHMNPIYIVFGGFLWKVWCKKVSLWYVHRKVDLKLRIAEKLCDVIFTATKESFNLKSKKLQIIGHGINVSEFICKERQVSSVLNILHVGRITPIKNCDTVIRAVGKLSEKSGLNFKLNFIGDTVMESDKKYLYDLKQMVSELGLQDKINFLGSIHYSEIKKYYCQSDLLINACPTGGIDKAVLEAMASGVSVLVSNRAFEHFFGGFADLLIFEERNSDDLAVKIDNLLSTDRQKEITTFLSQMAKRNFNLDTLVKKIIAFLK